MKKSIGKRSLMYIYIIIGIRIIFQIKLPKIKLIMCYMIMGHKISYLRKWEKDRNVVQSTK